MKINRLQPARLNVARDASGVTNCWAGLGRRVHPLSDHDICFSTGHNGLQFFLLGLRHTEFVKRLLEVLKESLPLGVRNHQILMRITHGTTSVKLWATGRPADHLRL